MESNTQSNNTSISERRQSLSSTEFGEYFSNAYELLEQTLALLNITDLLTASRVCKSWYQAVRVILRKKEKDIHLRWFIHGDNTCNSVHKLENGNNIRFRSQFVLTFRRKKFRRSVVASELLVPKYWMKDCAEQKVFDDEKRKINSEKGIPGLFGDCFVIETESLIIPSYTDKNNIKLQKGNGTSIFFPRMEGCNVNSLIVNDSSDSNIIKQKLLSDAEGPVKGILVFASNADENTERCLFKDILECNESSPFALAGGMYRLIEQLRGKKEITKHNFLLIRFCGDNINCFSAVLSSQKQDRQSIELFMNKMKNDLEEIDIKKQRRIAFIIRCVGRNKADLENELFHKYFPNIPAFITDSFGEYGYRFNTYKQEEIKKPKLSDVQVIHSYCSVFFFLTIQPPL